MKEQFTIATWNIGGAHTINSSDTFDYDKEDVGYFAKILKSLNPDIVCLQESHTNADGAISRRIAELLDLPFVFDSPRSPSHIDDNYQLANAIISRYPIENTRHVLLPDPPFELYFRNGRKARRFPTYVQIAQIGDITVANTHLQPLGLFGYSWDRGEGKQLAVATEDIFIANLESPLVFAGDFNFPDLERIFPRLMPSLQLKSALDDSPTAIHGLRLDYILYSPELSSQKAKVIVTDKSDHYVGWAELLLL